jgi:polysaccharide export outer membrane protein
MNSERIIMRQALRSALLAVVPVVCVCYGSQDSKPQAAPPAQEKPVATPPAVLSPKATIPSGLVPGAGQPSDPVKMGAPSAKPHNVAPVDDKTYVIGSEDVLWIDVWDDPRLTRAYTVRPDGYISILLINEIKAADKTPAQLREDIIERLKAGEFLRSPEVNVNVQEVRSKKYFLQGEVKKPGSAVLVIPTQVLEALVNAGGFNDFADKKHITIHRKGGKRFNFNYNEVIQGKKTEQNIYLEPGDIIIVK